MGKFETLTAEQIAQRLENAKDAAPSPSKKRRARSAPAPEKGLLQFVASETISGKYSLYKEQAPPAAKEYVDVQVNVAGLVAPTQPKVRVLSLSFFWSSFSKIFLNNFLHARDSLVPYVDGTKRERKCQERLRLPRTRCTC